MSSVADRVAMGASYLDANHPGWRDKINLERLDIMDGRDCIVAQLVGDYTRRSELGIYTGDQARSIGLNIDEDVSSMDLNVEWRKEITAHREAFKKAA